MSRPRLLDAFCGAGGAAVGYHRAGFEVVGVDHSPQPNFPFGFVRADALEYIAECGGEYDVIHASPPCQGYSRMRHLLKVWRPELSWPLLIDDCRRVLAGMGRPWVIENVGDAPLEGIRLCGTMFGLKVYRHRLFESNMLLLSPPHPKHSAVIGSGRRFNDRRKPNEDGRVSHTGKGSVTTEWGVCGHNFSVPAGMAAMGIEHRMTRDEIAQSIPPAYTEYIGSQLIDAVMKEEGRL